MRSSARVGGRGQTAAGRRSTAGSVIRTDSELPLAAHFGLRLLSPFAGTTQESLRRSARRWRAESGKSANAGSAPDEGTRAHAQARGSCALRGRAEREALLPLADKGSGTGPTGRACSRQRRDRAWARKRRRGRPALRE